MFRKNRFLNVGSYRVFVIIAVTMVLVSVGLVLLGGFLNNSEAVNNSQKNSKTQNEVLSAVDKKSVVVTKSQIITEPVPYVKATIEDASLPKGTTKLKNVGINGVKTKVFEVEYTDRIETGRRLVSEEITKQPINEVTAIGTFIAPLPVARP